jgi:hypothetical protein
VQDLNCGAVNANAVIFVGKETCSKLRWTFYSTVLFVLVGSIRLPPRRTDERGIRSFIFLNLAEFWQRNLYIKFYSVLEIH